MTEAFSSVPIERQPTEQEKLIQQLSHRETPINLNPGAVLRRSGREEQWHAQKNIDLINILEKIKPSHEQTLSKVF